MSLRIAVSQGQLRWFAIRRLLSCVFFGVALIGVAGLIVWVEYRMMLFALVAVFFALIAAAYGWRMARVALTAQTQTMVLTPTTLTWLVDGVSTSQAFAGVRTYPAGLAVVIPGGMLIDLPLGRARMPETLVELRQEGIPFEAMSGIVQTLLPVFGAVLMFVVMAVLVRVVGVGLFVGMVKTAQWSPWLAAVLLAGVGLFGVIRLVLRWKAALGDLKTR